MPHESEAATPSSSEGVQAPQLKELLAQLYREFGYAAPSSTPLTGVSLCMTYVGREPVVGTMGDSTTPHAHGIEAAAALIRMALRSTADPRIAALLDKAARVLDAAEHLKSGMFFETNTKH